MQPTNNEQSGATSSSISSSSGPQQSASSWNARTWSSSSSFQSRSFQPTSFRPTSYASSSTSLSPVVYGQSNSQSILPALDPSRLTPVFQETVIQAPSRDSQKLVNQSFKKGALSIKEDREMLEKIKIVLSEQTTQTIALRKQIDESVTSFYDESMKMNKLCSSLAFEIAKALKDATIASIRTGEALRMDYDERNRSVEFTIHLATQVGHRYYETAKQFMDLQRINTDGRFKDYQECIDLVFYARKQELDLLKSRLEVLAHHENHELQIMTALHNQKLKEESQLFDQLMQGANFVSEQNEKEIKFSIEERELAQSHEVDLVKLSLEKERVELEGKKAENEKEIEELKEKNKMEVEKYLAEKHVEIEGKRIDADTRCRLTETAATVTTTTLNAVASIAKPKCLLM
ncbi:hypothetical protein NEOC65_000020 [Neochlamydia sp. AcF65]|uniref:hypothetical protein n=1 Tax=unclassified Neochlamydia TaxID=2643326 RepID=UPI00140AB26E|nr:MULTISPECIES: hypothetical protein [unclassified Neochlamydia]MBS4164974.1 hypothetical protein [Neochlamydia sp. AcF65]NGY94339.1 hypothetical protein [Neochlamydia sp. AcF84]